MHSRLMSCGHDGYREIRSRYEGDAGVLVYEWMCEECSAPLGEAARTAYRPQFEPSGNDPYLTSLGHSGRDRLSA